MTKKSGFTTEVSSPLFNGGNSYYQHRDADGSVTGYSVPTTDYMGREETRHYNSDWERTATSFETTDVWGNSSTVSTDEWND